MTRFRLGERVLDDSNVNPADEATVRASRAVAVICKATEEISFHDWMYPRSRTVAKKLRLPFGGYLFLRPRSDGAAQAAAFLAYAKPKPGDIEPIIDSETTDGRPMSLVALNVDECAHALEAHGYKPLLYGSTSWLQQLYADRPGLRRLRVWQAEYPSFLPGPVKARLRRRSKLGHGVSVVMWQYTSRWQVRGHGFDGSYLLQPLERILIPPPAKPKAKPRTLTSKGAK